MSQDEIVALLRRKAREYAVKSTACLGPEADRYMAGCLSARVAALEDAITEIEKGAN